MSLKKSTNNKNGSALTIVICSNRIDKIKKYTIPFVLQINDIHRVLILLDSKTKNIDYNFVKKLNKYKNINMILCTQSGLSNLRNFALNYCNTKFIIFIDDDVTINNGSIKAMRDALNKGEDIAGLKLKPPSQSYIKRWFFTENQYHYIGLHTVSNNTSIWGACMAFNLDLIKKTKLYFYPTLDRQGNKLLSGGDTTFIQKLKDKGAKTKLLNNYFAIHHVDNTRLTFFGFLRRVFWQGITESVRCNVKPAITKEFGRNFHIINIVTLPIGATWFFIFILGIVYGLFYRKIYGSTQ